MVLLGLITTVPPAYAQHNDSAQVCSAGGEKKWYFAIGRSVFEITEPEVMTAALIHNVDPKYALIPPNPSSPVGCEDNPQQLAEFSIINWPYLEPQNYVGDMPIVADLTELYRYPYSNIVPPSIDPVIEGLESAALECQNKKFIERWDNGTILCANKTGQLNPLLNAGHFQFGVGWEFIISGNKYLTPLGQNLVMSELTTGVDVDYRIAPDVSLHYTWSLPKSASQVDADYLIGVDTLFQKSLLAYQKANYSWPRQASN